MDVFYLFINELSRLFSSSIRGFHPVSAKALRKYQGWMNLTIQINSCTAPKR
jgi:hypothetical protein